MQTLIRGKFANEAELILLHELNLSRESKRTFPSLAQKEPGRLQRLMMLAPFTSSLETQKKSSRNIISAFSSTSTLPLALYLKCQSAGSCKKNVFVISMPSHNLGLPCLDQLFLRWTY